jgi:hypothetical protein
VQQRQQLGVAHGLGLLEQREDAIKEDARLSALAKAVAQVSVEQA